MPPRTARQLAETLLDASEPPAPGAEAADQKTAVLAMVSPESAADPVDYPARDMTITVPAGMTIERLAEILRSESQQLPIDSPRGDFTVGQLIAEDVCGPRRFGYGTLRDYLIGLEALDGRGRLFHSGGQVVKNVAGYDLCRLLTGCRNSLALLTRVTLKLKPLPAATGLLAAGIRDVASAEAALQRLNLSAARPMVLDLCWPAAVDRYLAGHGGSLGQLFAPLRDRLVMVLAVDGTAETCDWQLQTLRRELEEFSDTIRSESDADCVTEYCRATTPDASCDSNRFRLLRVSTVPSQFVPAASALADAGLAVFGRAGDGEIFAMADSDTAIESADALWRRLPEPLLTSEEFQISVAADGWQSRMTDDERRVWTALRKQFDPQSLLPAFERAEVLDR